MRIIVDLRTDQVAALAELCASDRISRAEAIRRAIDAMIDKRRSTHTEAILKRTFGAWKHLGIDTDTYLAEIRSEWDREWDK